MEIRQATKKDFNGLLEMALLLWPDDPESQVTKDVQEMLSSSRQAVFICLDKNDKYAGFIDVSTRREYVPGATVFPIGYIEGIYVRSAYRRKGIARKLVEFGEKWALEKGCQQMASDTWVWNTVSQEFHTSVGFKEAERLVTYIKRIETDR